MANRPFLCFPALPLFVFLLRITYRSSTWRLYKSIKLIYESAFFLRGKATFGARDWHSPILVIAAVMCPFLHMIASIGSSTRGNHKRELWTAATYEMGFETCSVVGGRRILTLSFCAYVCVFRPCETADWQRDLLFWISMPIRFVPLVCRQRIQGSAPAPSTKRDKETDAIVILVVIIRTTCLPFDSLSAQCTKRLCSSLGNSVVRCRNAKLSSDRWPSLRMKFSWKRLPMATFVNAGDEHNPQFQLCQLIWESSLRNKEGTMPTIYHAVLWQSRCQG